MNGVADLVNPSKDIDVLVPCRNAGPYAPERGCCESRAHLLWAKATAPLRHAARVGSTKLFALLEAARVEHAGSDQAMAALLILADIVGEGGHGGLGGPHGRSRRAPWAQRLGSGRTRSGDGDAYTAAAVEALRHIASAGIKLWAALEEQDEDCSADPAPVLCVSLPGDGEYATVKAGDLATVYGARPLVERAFLTAEGFPRYPDGNTLQEIASGLEISLGECRWNLLVDALHHESELQKTREKIETGILGPATEEQNAEGRW